MAFVLKCPLPTSHFQIGEDVSWRILRVMAELTNGFEFLSKLKKEVSIFGSARLPEDSPYYQKARELSNKLAMEGFTIVTGGGPGIMEAGNRGAFDVGGQSVGLNVMLPHEQRTNQYVGKSVAFDYFFTRKVMLTAVAQVYIFFPGGFGTIDELMEILVLMQTKKMERLPMICFGREYWGGLDDWVKKNMLEVEFPMIGPEDRQLYNIVDTVEEAIAIVRNSKERLTF